MRQTKPMSVLGGIGFMPRLGQFLSVAYAVNRSVVIEPFFEFGDYAFIGNDGSRIRSGLRVLWFHNNSFYMSTGVNYELYTRKEDFDRYVGINASESSQYEGRHHQIEAEVGIGNRWTMKSGFTIGATWVGLSRGIVNLGRTSSSVNMDADEQRRQDKKLDISATAPFPHFAKLLLGWSF